MLRRQFLGFAGGWITGIAAQAKRVRTIAGVGVAGYSGDDGPGESGHINNPYGMTIGPDGALYFCEVNNHCVRRLDLRTRILSTVAGNLRRGYSGDGGQAIEATMNQPYEVRFDSAGNMYVVEMQNHVVRRIDAKTSVISTVAGTGERGFGGDKGPARRALLDRPHSIEFDGQGRLLICDIGNHRVRRVDLKTGIIETWLGTGERKLMSDGAPLNQTPVFGPRAIEMGADRSLYLLLREGNAIFRIDEKSQRFVHVAGSGERGYSGDGGPAKAARFDGPKGLARDPDGGLFVADTENHVIRHIDFKTGRISTVLGTGERGDGPDGDPRACRLNRPHGVCVDLKRRLFVADSENHRIRILR